MTHTCFAENQNIIMQPHLCVEYFSRTRSRIWPLDLTSSTEAAACCLLDDDYFTYTTKYDEALHESIAMQLAGAAPRESRQPSCEN